MTPTFFLDHALAPALTLLPSNMDTPAARAMLLAIALQESRIIYRHQVGGPAHSYFQFELGGGVRGVLKHPASKSHAQAVLASLDYDPESDPASVYEAMEHNDILAAGMARLLLWTLPTALPGPDDPEAGWKTYIAAWRPGKPHRSTWNSFYAQAWSLV